MFETFVIWTAALWCVCVHVTLACDDVEYGEDAQAETENKKTEQQLHLALFKQHFGRYSTGKLLIGIKIF